MTSSAFLRVVVVVVKGNNCVNKSQGFTLIELIIVIVILGILSVVAAPRFVDLSDDAEKAVFRATAGAFKDGIKHVHYAWIIRGEGQAQQDFIPISDPIVGGDLSVNAAGFPADTRGVSLTLNSDNDCLDVWRAVLASQGAEVENDDSSDYEGTYIGANSCTYSLTSQPALTVQYNSNTGEVAINF